MAIYGPPNVYSAKIAAGFVSLLPGATEAIFLAPEGYRIIVTDVDMTINSTTTGDVAVIYSLDESTGSEISFIDFLNDGSITYPFGVPPLQTWRGRRILDTGDAIYIGASQPVPLEGEIVNWWISGYSLLLP